MQLLPIFSQHPTFSYRIKLTQRMYDLRWRWNQRAGWWMLDISLADGTPVVTGLRVVVGTALPSYRNSSLLPPGSIIALDMSGDQREIEAREELGQRVKVVYLEPGEVPVSIDVVKTLRIREAS